MHGEGEAPRASVQRGAVVSVAIVGLVLVRRRAYRPGQQEYEGHPRHGGDGGAHFDG